MLYTVECSFADPASEAEWNDFYSREKLPALISVEGFRSSQRFKALRDGGPTYLALHAIDGLHVLSGAEYRQKGGGNFARWQRHIADWHRNLYDGLERAPAVARDEVLLVSADGPASLLRLGLAPHGLHAVELDKVPAQRWLARCGRARLPAIGELAQDLQAYAPMTAQLVAARGIARTLPQ
ncbi:hypothetical protein FHR56_000294 [Xanthomonas sacchari]|uniref:sugar ABC transporter n=1 Tax=unclassified Xanthomonas TaxID=2643310 RepID=UPI00136E2AF0|nr:MULTISPECIES: sugar ABC transporter [unclassified Xanthomonas]MBB6365181.1 hypothetical protein [Xanthomonas sp. F10]MXV34546.1 sugar ABC transporter [Xanthomonas sp. LMG 8989]